MNKKLNKNSILWKYQNPVIFYYHLISDIVHPYYPHGAINPSDFHEQIKNLKKRFVIISLPEAIERVVSGNLLKNSLVLTIHDGFKECYSVIAPILADEKIPATFFLIENTINNKNMMWLHQLEYLQQTLSLEKRIEVSQEFLHQIKKNIKPESNLLELSRKWNMKDKDKFVQIIWNLAYAESNSNWLHKNQPYMSIQQIQELIDAGFTIGSHSATHPSCDRLSYEELENEIAGSCKQLRNKLKVEIKYFSYPFGRRAKREYEYKLLEKSNLQCLIGGKPRLFRKNNYLYWEAYNFERNNFNLIYHLLVNSFSFK
jgi:peptidoglycan/xylan/chitin deacetylase (PgdA/CDA1 family)